MTGVAFAFPGQGAEATFAPSACAAWFSHEAFAAASEATGLDVARAWTRASSDMKRTAVLQPALVALALVAHERLRARGVEADFVCGHSVGEIAAWAASGAISSRDAIAFAARRGAAMDEAALASPGGMAAIDAADEARALAIEGVEIAARNGPRQIVVAGPEPAIAAVVRALGGRRLVVAGAWHSRAMHAAREATRAALAAVVVSRARVPIVTCLGGRVLEPDASPDFVAQLTAPVEWDAVSRTLARAEVADVVCFAPGRVNRALFRDALGSSVRLHVVDCDADVDRVAQRLQGTEHDRAAPRP